jgi:PIN domain nuclease of toxin-antitoxin system
VKLLLDTHVLLWASGVPEKLSEDARALIEDAGTEPVFSAASLWEIAIKNGLGRADFEVDPRVLHRELLANGYAEVAVTGAHATAIGLLPPIHKDPFDRILIAQAQVEGMTLLTADEIVGRYPGPIRVL